MSCGHCEFCRWTYLQIRTPSWQNRQSTTTSACPVWVWHLLAALLNLVVCFSKAVKVLSNKSNSLVFCLYACVCLRFYSKGLLPPLQLLVTPIVSGTLCHSPTLKEHKDRMSTKNSNIKNTGGNVWDTSRNVMSSPPGGSNRHSQLLSLCCHPCISALCVPVTHLAIVSYGSARFCSKSIWRIRDCVKLLNHLLYTFLQQQHQCKIILLQVSIEGIQKYQHIKISTNTTDDDVYFIFCSSVTTSHLGLYGVIQTAHPNGEPCSGDESVADIIVTIKNCMHTLFDIM